MPMLSVENTLSKTLQSSFSVYFCAELHMQLISMHLGYVK